MRRILIIGGDSDFNLGDAAILSSLCECLVKLDARIEITITSKQPSRSRWRGVTRVVRRGPKSFASLLSAAHDSDLVILGGGGLFQDDDSRIKMPFWATQLATLKIANRNVVGHSLGAGPLKHAESRQFARLACKVLHSVSVRDHFAHRWLAPCTSRTVAVVPDPAFMLPAAERQHAMDLIRALGLPQDKPIIGVALRRWYHRLGGFIPHRVRSLMRLDRGHGEAELEAFLSELSLSLATLARRLDASILMLPTYNVSHEDDAGVCKRLSARLPGISTGIAEINDPQLYKAVTGELALMVASRMHPLILAAGMGTPILGLAYNGKFNGLFELLQLPYEPLWLDSLKETSFAVQLETLAVEALRHGDLIGTRAEQLAAITRQKTAALLGRAA